MINSILQIFVLSIVIYYVLVFIKGTRGANILIGLTIVLLILVGGTHLLQWTELNWLLRKFFVGLTFTFIVIFHPEIRRALAEIGKQRQFIRIKDRKTLVDNLVQAVSFLAENKIGALIAVEQNIGTKAVQETGVKLNASVTPELLASIFFPKTPLHDGGVIISQDKIIAAACVFPLSQNIELHKRFGMRHRAGIGLSEETDAVIIVVSEETGTISVCYRGRISQGLDEERLRRFLSALLLKETKSVWKRVQDKLDLTPEALARSEEEKME